MDVFRTLWPGVVNEVGVVKELLQNEVIAKLPSKLHSARSLEALAARSEHSETAQIIGSAFLYIQFVVVFLGLLALSYTLNNVFPVLAIVEDDSPPPSYTEVTDKDATGTKDSTDIKAPLIDEEAVSRTQPVTSSLRGTYRLLKSIDGKKSLFRGAALHIQAIAVIFVAGLFLSALPFMNPIIATVIATMLTLQLSAAWTHTVISEPSKKSLWSRLPPSGLTFRATALPSLVFNLASSFMGTASSVIARVMLGRRVGSDNYLGFLFSIGIYLLLLVFVSIPAHVVLVRAQASMLPKETQTIVSLDRGLMMHRVEGKEYMSMLQAWRSFSRASWVRLVKLYAKTFAVHVVVFLVLGVIGAAEFFIASLL